MTAGAVSTVAGDGTAAVQDGTGTAAKLNNPVGMSIAGGSGYFYDSGYFRKVALATGVVTTVAGDGTGLCSDSSGISAAQSGGPLGGIVNDGSFLYWFESSNQGSCRGVLRRMSLTTGAVSTVPGVYGSYPTVGPGGVLYMVQGGGTVSRVNTDTGVITTLATPTQTSGGTTYTEDIRGITADASSVWVTGDYNCNPSYGCTNDAVSKVAVTTGTVITIYNQPIYSTPYVNGPMVSAGNYLYLTSSSAQLLRMKKADGSLAGVAGAGSGYIDATGPEAWLSGVTGVDTDGTHLWVTDSGNSHRIREVTSATPLPDAEPSGWTVNLAMAAGAVSTVAGDGTAAVQDGTGTSAKLNNPTGMSIAGGSGYFFDSGYIRKLDLATGVVRTVSGDGTQGCADSSDSTATSFAGPLGNIANDGSFLYWFESSSLGSCGGGGTGVLRRMSLKTGAVSRIPGNVYGQSVTVGPGGALFAVRYTSIYEVNPGTGAITLLSSPLDGVGTYHYNDNIRGVTADGSSIWTTAYVGCDPNYGCRYVVISKTDIGTGTVTNFTNDINTYPHINGPLVSAGNYLYLAGSGAILRFTKTDGTLSGVAGSGSYGGLIDATGADAWFSNPAGIDTDGTHLWISDVGNHRIREVTSTTPLPDAEPSGWTVNLAMAAGAVSTVAGDGTAAVQDGTGTGAKLNNPVGMSIAGASGYFYDSGYVRKVALATGVVTTVAGDGTGHDQDSANPATAQVGNPAGGLVNDGSFLYWFDTYNQGGGNGLLRRMSLTTGAVSTVPGNIYGSYPAVGPGGTLYALVAGGVSKINTDVGAVTLLATPTQTVNGTTYGEEIRGITADASSIWVTGSYHQIPYSYGYYNDAVSKIDVGAGTVTTVYTGDLSSSPDLNGPVVSAGNYLYLTGYYSNQVMVLAKSGGVPAVVAGSTTGGYADGYGAGARFSNISGIDADGNGGLWVSDAGNHLIRRVIAAPPGAPTVTFPTSGVSPVELPGGGNASEVCACSQGQATSWPVNTNTGAFWHSFTDLATPGRGPGLGITRTYVSSMATPDSPFGHGWSFNYGLNLTVDPANGNVTVHQEDGSQIGFAPGSASGSFAPLQPRMLATLKQNANGQYTFTRRLRTIFTFGSAGLLKSVADLNGNTTGLAYDQNGNLATVTDQNGRTYTVTVDGNGHITKVTDQAARSVTYGYSAAGDLTSSIDPTGAKTTFTYDTQHRLLTMLDPNQQSASNPSPLTNVYDSAGRVTQQTDFAGRATSFDYTAISGATKVTDPAGHVTVDYYGNGLRTKSTSGYGTSAAATVTYSYDPVTEAITSVTDPLNHTTSSTYDARGNTLTTTDALNHTTTHTYDALNDQLTTTDAKGTTTTRTFDAGGNLTSSATPLKGAGGSTTATLTTTYRHGNGGHPEDVTSVVNPNGKTTIYSHDAYGDLTAITAPPTPENPAGNKTTYFYNTTTGWRLSQVSPRGNLSGATAANFKTSYAYDDDGRLTRIRDSLWTSAAPTQHQITNTYDLDGNLASSTDKKANVTSYTYDADNELIKTTLPDSTLTQQTWTPNGQLKTSTDAAGHVTTYTYDAVGNLATSTDPLNRTTTYTYDTAGNLTLRAVPNATCTGATPTTGCTSYTYNADNQLTAKAYLDGATTAVTGITYDADGLPTGHSDATGTQTAAYDNLGRLTSYTDGAGATIAYGYDLDGNTTSIGYPGANHTVTRTFDALDRLASLKDWNNNTVTFGYDADSDPATTTFPAATGETDTTNYDNLDTITAISDNQTTGSTTTTLAGFAYTRDANSQVATASTTGLTEAPQTYAHDPLSRLTASGSTVTPTTYGYSASDDILNRGTTSGSTANTQAFNAADRLCWTSATTVTNPACGTVPAGATTYFYDVNGNRKTTTTGTAVTRYLYDEEQHLTRYTPPTGAATSYTYDADGLRQTKTTGSTTTHFTWDKNNPTPLLLADATYYYLYDNTGTPLEQINTTTGATTWLHHDQLGTTRLLTNTTGTTVGTATYDPYGTKTASTGTTTSPLGYNGQYTDTETGLIYLRARYYDPTTAQFLTLDPLAAQTGQPYAYAGDAPLDATDPTGLCSWGCIGGHLLSVDEGFANAFTFGAVARLDETISPGSTCTYSHDGYYSGGEVAGIATFAYLSGGASVAAEGAAANTGVPIIKAGSEGGETAGKVFSQRVRQQALDENPNVCVYCRMETDRPQVDHVIPRSQGGNATLENAQTTCGFCNASKGARQFPVNPPPGFEGLFPPSWWGLL